MNTQPLAQFDASQIDATTYRDWGITFFNTGAAGLDDGDIVLCKDTSSQKIPTTFGELKNDFALLQRLAGKSGHNLRIAYGQDRFYILDDFKKNTQPGQSPEISGTQREKEAQMFQSPTTVVDRIYAVNTAQGDDVEHNFDQWAYRPEYLYAQVDCLFAVIKDEAAQASAWQSLNAQATSAQAFISSGNFVDDQFQTSSVEVAAFAVQSLLTSQDIYLAAKDQQIDVTADLPLAENFFDDSEYDF